MRVDVLLGVPLIEQELRDLTASETMGPVGI